MARPAANAQHLCPEVGRETARERAMQVREAEDASTAHAGTPFQDVDAPAALIAVGRQV